MGRLLIQFPGTTTAKALTETLSKNVIIVDEDLHQLRLHDGSTAGGHLIGGSSGSGVPVGTIIPFAGNSIPQGYLLCDGSAISRTTYASLFAVIGTIYGAGDGNSTFNLPNWTQIVTNISIPSTIPVYGNGKTLGFTNGTDNLGLFLSTNEPMILSINAYDKNVGTTGITNITRTAKTLGITYDSTKSGIVAKSNNITQTKTNPNIKISIKY